MIEHSSDGHPIWRDSSQSLTEALFEARDEINALRQMKLKQGSRLIALVIENAALTVNPEGEMTRKHRRLLDAVCAVEHFAHTCERRGTTPLLAILLPLLRDAIEYGDGGALSSPLAWAMRDAYREAAKGGAS